MATLDFPNPADYPIYEEAGIKWTWNSTLNVWSTDVATGGGGGGDGGPIPVIDGEALPDPVNYDEGQLIYFNNTADDGGSRLYIRLDDTDGNAIWVDVSLPGGGGGGLVEPVTFEQLTTHEGGANVTGISTITYSNGSTTDTALHVDASYESESTNPQPFRLDIDFNNQPVDGNSFLMGIGFVRNIDSDNPPDRVVGMAMSTGFNQIPNSVPITGLLVGVDKKTDDDGNPVDNWSIDSRGSAPSYFKGGIQFDNASGAAKLDAYEEGNWSPQIQTTNSDIAIDYTKNTGTYVKIGQLVYLQATIKLNALTGGTGNVRITNLPFTTVDGVDKRSSFSIGYALNFPAQTPVSGLVGSNSTSVSIYRQVADGGYVKQLQAMPISDWDGNSEIRFSGIYTAS